MSPKSLVKLQLFEKFGCMKSSKNCNFTEYCSHRRLRDSVRPMYLDGWPVPNHHEAKIASMEKWQCEINLNDKSYLEPCQAGWCLKKSYSGKTTEHWRENSKTAAKIGAKTANKLVRLSGENCFQHWREISVTIEVKSRATIGTKMGQMFSQSPLQVGLF